MDLAWLFKDWAWWRFIWGAVGALLFEGVRIYRITTGQTTIELPALSLWYVIGVLSVMTAGGFIPVLSKFDTPWKCFAAGVAVPTTMGTLASQNYRV